MGNFGNNLEKSTHTPIRRGLNKEIVLYTDSDILFQRDVQLPPAPLMTFAAWHRGILHVSQLWHHVHEHDNNAKGVAGYADSCRAKTVQVHHGRASMDEA